MKGNWSHTIFFSTTLLGTVIRFHSSIIAWSFCLTFDTIRLRRVSLGWRVALCRFLVLLFLVIRGIFRTFIAFLARMITGLALGIRVLGGTSFLGFLFLAIILFLYFRHGIAWRRGRFLFRSRLL